MFMLTHNGTAADFAVAIEPAANTAEHVAAGVSCTADGEALTVIVTRRDGKQDRIVWTPAAAVVTQSSREILRATPQ